MLRIWVSESVAVVYVAYLLSLVATNRAWFSHVLFLSSIFEGSVKVQLAGRFRERSRGAHHQQLRRPRRELRQGCLRQVPGAVVRPLQEDEAGLGQAGIEVRRL